MKLERDNFGRLVVRRRDRDDTTFWLSADGELVMGWLSEPDARGFRTRHAFRVRRPSASAERIRAMLLIGDER